MNLIRDPWIPIRRASGRVERIAPWQITEPIVGLASPRADFDGALAQLLVGMLQAALGPSDGKAWRRLLAEPPSPEDLREAFEPLADHFELLGDGPRFLQDLTLLDDDPKEIGVEKLLIDAGLHEGRDHFRKGGQVEGLCLPCTTMALTTLQLQAPVGGRGHRASPRGGGPLTTLLRHRESLWQTLWANVLLTGELDDLGNPEKSALSDRFPWVGPTLVSDSPKKIATAQTIHPLHLYWPMPRRLRLLDLDLAPDEPALTCDLCGDAVRQGVGQVAVRHHGFNYSEIPRHPLSPSRQLKDGRWIPAPMTDKGLVYRQWRALVLGADGTQPAPVVQRFRDRLRSREARSAWFLWAFGYDMDNMKARCWYEGPMEQVLLGVEDPDHQEDLRHRAGCLIAASDYAQWALTFAIKQVISNRPKEVKGDLSAAGIAFLQATERTFYEHLAELEGVVQIRDQDRHQEAWQSLAGHWHRLLVREAGRIFEHWSGGGLFQAVDPRQVADAWNELQGKLWGQKMKGHLDVPELRTPRPPAVAAQTAVAPTDPPAIQETQP